jgi:hypothetical protein
MKLPIVNRPYQIELKNGIVMFVETTPIGNWLDKKFREWQDKLGRSQDLKDFYDYLEISKATWYRWVGGTTPEKEAVDKLAQKTGDLTIYDLAGYERPGGGIELLRAMWGGLPDETQQRIVDIAIREAQRSKTNAGGKSLGGNKQRG